MSETRCRDVEPNSGVTERADIVVSGRVTERWSEMVEDWKINGRVVEWLRTVEELGVRPVVFYVPSTRSFKPE